MDRTLFVTVLLAVFASLAAGVLLGGELASDRRLVTEQDRLLAGLEREFERLRNDAAALRRELAALDQLRASELAGEDALAERLTAGMLSSTTVAVIGLGDPTALDRACAALERAGADVAMTAVVTPAALADLSASPEAELAAVGEVVAGIGGVLDGVTVQARLGPLEVDAVVVCSSVSAHSQSFLSVLLRNLGDRGSPVVVAWMGVPSDGADLAAPSVTGIERGAGAAALCDAVAAVIEKGIGHD